MTAGSWSSLVRRWKILGADWLRYSSVVHFGAWTVFCIKSVFARGQCRKDWALYPTGIDEACSAARCAATDSQMRMAESLAERRLEGLARRSVLLPRTIADLKVDKSAVLKPALPGGEKGVVFISFERNWQRLMCAGTQAMERLEKQYRFILAPTWSPPHSTIGYLFPRMFDSPVFSTLSNVRDLDLMPRLSGNYRLLPLYASSWVSPEIFSPLSASERDIDVIVLSNFAKYKRHHVLFRALAKIPAAKRPRVMLVGQPDGSRTGEVLFKEAADFGVRECIELRQSVSDAEVCALLCRSKCALITSRREGSCVAVVEAMMAGAPVGLLRGAQIGSAAFLNEQTGRWLDEAHLERDLLKLIADAPSFSSREWLIKQGIECHSSTRTANDILREEALKNGEPWTQDLWTLHWRPNPQLLDSTQEKLALAETEVIRRTHGIHFGVFEGLV
ncbi:MAG: glycosyltransferase [Verrucomicrobiaceae bacterium]|nr:glycosyltransferase [Verrucomicrobiaceae bacterium]